MLAVLSGLAILLGLFLLCALVIVALDRL